MALMFCVRADFHSRVIFTCVNEIEAMYERLCVNAKIKPSLNFYVYAQTFIHSLYFIYVRKINVRTARKNYATVETNLKVFFTYRALFDLWSEKIVSPKSRTFSANDIYLKNGGRKGLANQFMFRSFFSSSNSLVDELRLIFMAQNANMLIIAPLCSIYKAVQGKFFIS